MYTLYSIHYPVYIVQYTLYSIHYTIYTVQYTLYSVHCTVYTVQYRLYSVHYREASIAIGHTTDSIGRRFQFGRRRKTLILI